MPLLSSASRNSAPILVRAEKRKPGETTEMSVFERRRWLTTGTLQA